MAMSFEECLHEICQELLLTPEDRQSIAKDVEVIRNSLMNGMKEHNASFKSAFDGLSLTGSCLDHVKIDLPDEFDYNIKLKMPFSITPQRDKQRPGFVGLHVAKGTRHDLVQRNRVSRFRLQRWIRNILIKVVGHGMKVPVGNRMYEVTYPTYGRGEGVAHTIIAREIGGELREISFDFVPTFEFQPSQWPFEEKFNVANVSWFAVPFGKRLRNNKERSNKFAFMVSAPHWERIALHNKQNLKNSLRLMKALRNVNKLGRLSSYMLKSVFLEQLDLQPEDFWQNPMGVILIEMLDELAKALRENSLPFFLHKGFNHMNLVPKKLISEYQNKLHNILKNLRHYQLQSRVDYVDIVPIFIRQR